MVKFDDSALVVTSTSMLDIYMQLNINWTYDFQMVQKSAISKEKQRGGIFPL